MRQRKVKNLEEKLKLHRAYMIENPKEYKGHWREVFLLKNYKVKNLENSKLKLEVGCGKGKFITDMAKIHPENFYIAIEGNPSVALYALRKIKEAGIENVKIYPGYLDSMEDFFEEGELDAIYLNFSDPWPKDRHSKRRLTHRRRLKEYYNALTENGYLEFKTDNDDLFQFSLDEVYSQSDFKLESFTRDLHKENNKGDIVTTEYEEKFSSQGKNINFLRLVK